MKQKRERNKGVLIPLIFIALAVTLCSIGIGTASAETTVAISPSEKAVDNGETFTVNIAIDPDTAIGGAQADLTFDPSLVTVNRVDDGGMFPGFMVIGPTDNVEGKVTGIIGYSTGGATTTTPGTLAVVSMTANATNNGTSTIGLFNVIVSDGEGTEVSSTAINGTVAVGVTVIPPSVSVVYPNGGETLRGTVTVSATVSDEDGTVTNVEFLYSADAGSTWTSLGSDTSEPYECEWDTTTVLNGVNYLIKAIATDNDGATGEDTSDSTFAIENIAGTAVIISPSEKAVDNGETFTVNIEIDPDTAIGGAQADLTFDPSLVTVNRVDDGGMFPGFMVIGPTDNVEGKVTGIIGYSTGGATTTTPGTLAVVSMTANATNNGTSTIGLFNVIVSDGEGTEVSSTAINGTVTVGVSAEAPRIITYTISNRTITPPQTTEIDVEFSEEVSWTIAIQKDAETVYDWTGTSTNPNKRVWDGTYEADGTTVPDGDYRVNVTGTSTTTGLSVVNDTEIITVTTEFNGYKGKRYTGGEDITTAQTHTVNGNVLCSVGDSYYLSGGSDAWSSYTANWTASDLPVPAEATIVKARLYVYYTWDKVQGMPENVSMTFNGNTVTREAFYTDRKGFGSYDYPSGMLAYNVTADFTASGNTAVLENLNPVAGNPSIYGMLLVAVYEKNGEPERMIWLNEECDMLQASDDNSVSSEEATAYAPFDGAIADVGNKSATLITVVPSGDEGDDKNRLYFNTGVWQGVWDGYAGDTQLSLKGTDVSAYLSATDNCAQLQSTIPAGDTKGDYMVATNAILVVELKLLKGDIDGNRKVDINDAIYLAKHVLGWSGYEVIHANGDIDGNGKVDTNDAIYLAKHVLGWSGYEEIH